jgi:hypothetical protein
VSGQGVAASARVGDRHPLEIVSCGQPLPGYEIGIVDKLGQPTSRVCRPTRLSSSPADRAEDTGHRAERHAVAPPRRSPKRAHRHAATSQILRLWLAGIRPQVVRSMTVGRDLLYAGWWWLVVGVAAVLAWIAVMVPPRFDQRWSAARRIVRSALAAMGVPVASGLDRLPRDDATLVFNQLSYVDALLLGTLSSRRTSIRIQERIRRATFAGPLLRRLGPSFVELYDSSRSLADTGSPIAVAGTAATSCSILRGHSRVLTISWSFPADGSCSARKGATKSDVPALGAGVQSATGRRLVLDMRSTNGSEYRPIF